MAATARHTTVLLKGTDLKKGHRVLDVACGVGNPTLEAARRVGPKGRVVGVDGSQPLLSLGRGYAQNEALSNVEFHVADAGNLPFKSETFDR